MRARSSLVGFCGPLAAAGLLIGACSGDDGGDDGAQTPPTQGVADSGSVSNSSVAPNTFLTFEGSRYRLESLEQANLPGSDQDYEEVGTASDADIDQTDLTVYRRDGESEAIYTYAAAQGEGDEATPPLWYRWVPES